LDIADRVWDELTIDHTISGSFGKLLADIEVEIEVITFKLPVGNIAENGEYAILLSNIETKIMETLGLGQSNYYLDNTVYTDYQGAKLLINGRIRTYSVSSSVGTNNDVMATYLITSTWVGSELQNYKVSKQQ
jgi:hypothetical protein